MLGLGLGLGTDHPRGGGGVGVEWGGVWGVGGGGYVVGVTRLG